MTKHETGGATRPSRRSTRSQAVGESALGAHLKLRKTLLRPRTMQRFCVHRKPCFKFLRSSAQCSLDGCSFVFHCNCYGVGLLP